MPFDGAFSPLHWLIVGVVALLALGPHELPDLARRAGQFVWELQQVRHHLGTELRDLVSEFDLDETPGPLESHVAVLQGGASPPEASTGPDTTEAWGLKVPSLVITQVFIGCAVGLVVAWAALALLLLAFRPPGQSLRDLAKVFPNSLRLAVALYRDPTLAESVRWRLRIAIIYNLQPINLIPDFIPMIGFADNAIVLLWALRSTIRVAGSDAVARHWPGTPQGLAVVPICARRCSD